MRVENVLSRVIGPFDRPWQWLAFAAAFLSLDYLTGPYVGFPFTFVLPVAFAAWHRGLVWALPLSVVLPLARIGVALLADPSLPRTALGVELAIRVVVLGLLSLLVDAVGRQLRTLEREVQTLTGLLPICVFCKQIRDPDGEWQRLEAYITKRSEASFTHSLCAACEALHYPE